MIEPTTSQATAQDADAVLLKAARLVKELLDIACVLMLHRLANGHPPPAGLAGLLNEVNATAGACRIVGEVCDLDRPPEPPPILRLGPGGDYRRYYTGKDL